MKALIVGYSDIARRRILPALDTMGLERIDIATSRPTAVDDAGLTTPLRVFPGYENGITQSDADLCCVSTVNSAHFSQARASLESGKHTVVDKPITLSRSEAESLVELSQEKGLMLSESVVYLSHSRLIATLAKLSESGLIPRHVSAVFCFPPLPGNNFRYDEALGGGVVADLGAYVVTPGRCFFHSRPRSVSAWITERRGTMPVGIRVVAVYDGGRSFSGYYSFDAEYQNEVRITGRDFYLHMDRFFTTPANLETTVRMRSGNCDDQWRFPPDDAFAAYLNRIRKGIGSRTMEDERQKIIDDQATLAMVRSALELDGVEQ